MLATFNLAWAATSDSEYDKFSASGVHPRMALIVGNGSYADEPLPNASRDALTMDERLRSLGFSVERHLNLGENEFRTVLQQFWTRANRYGGDAVFFYAGHGLGLGGRNYLIPTDVDAKSVEDIRARGIDLADVIGGRTKPHPNLRRVVILDACRNNPARRGILNGEAAGFFVADAPSSLISFSTSLGKRALDGPIGSNSYFTKHLAEELLVDEIEASVLFTRVRRLVVNDTKALQTPVEFNTLQSPFVFRSAPAESLSDEEQQIRREIMSRLSKGQTPIPADKVGMATEQLYRAITMQLDSEEQQRLAAQKRLTAEAQARDARRILNASRKLEAAEAERERLIALAAEAEVARRLEEARVSELERQRLTAREAEAAARVAEDARLAAAERSRAAIRDREATRALDAEKRRQAAAETERLALAASAESDRIAAQTAAAEFAKVERVALEAEQAVERADAQLRKAKEIVATSETQMRLALNSEHPAAKSRAPRLAADRALLVRGVKLPADLKVTSPAPDVPSPCKLFSGGWGGARWDDVRTVEIWIESVASNCALSIVYAFGGTSVTGSGPGFQRTSAVVIDGEARFRLANGGVIVLTATGNRMLTAALQDVNSGAYEVSLIAVDDKPLDDSGFYALEQRHSGVTGSVAIRATNFWKPVPDDVPGATNISTLELEAFLRERPDTVLLDTLYIKPRELIRGSQLTDPRQQSVRKTIPGALLMAEYGVAHVAAAERSFAEATIDRATSGDKQRPIVVFERNTRYGWYGYHVALRLVGLGFTNVRWYRGGLDAWHDAGFAVK